MKKWWKSKTEIGALFAAIALIVQTVTGTQWLDPTLQSALIVAYFAIIRYFTDEGITL